MFFFWLSSVTKGLLPLVLWLVLAFRIQIQPNMVLIFSSIPVCTPWKTWKVRRSACLKWTHARFVKMTEMTCAACHRQFSRSSIPSPWISDMILLRDYGLPCRYLLLDAMGDHAEVEFSRNFGSSLSCSGHREIRTGSSGCVCVCLTGFLMNTLT